MNTIALPLEISAPELEYGLLMPLIVLFGAACLGVLLEAALPRAARLPGQLLVTFLGIAAALVLVIQNWINGETGIVAVGSLAIDGPTYFLWTILLITGALSLLVFAERSLEGGTAFAPQAAAVPGTEAEREAIEHRMEHTEVFPLALFALTGMLLFPASTDLLTMFIALEVLSLPLYLLCGIARRRRLLSQEAALKYFLLGAFSSGFFLFGVALLYGYTGSFDLSAIDEAVTSSTQGQGLLLAGMVLLGVGLLFKLGAVPFHSWTPDVYVGAPTPVTGFMAACTKIAAFGALLRVFYVALGGARWDWQPMMAVVAVATMAIGSVLALTQTDVKRMLAYSSIAHAGFLLTAFVGAAQASNGLGAGQLSSLSASLFYLAAYGVTTVGAFAVLTMVRDAGGEVTSLAGWAGLGKKSPILAGIFAFFLLSFAGIPLTSGFVGKWAVFVAAWAGGYEWLVVVAVVISLVAAFFYLRIIVVMYFSVPAEGPTVVRPSVLTMGAIGVGLIATVVLGIFPGPLLDLAQHAGEFLR